MGCDIHAFVEYLEDGQWEHYASLSIGRYYELFGLLAGVRGGNPIYPVRGLPEDIDLETRYRYNEYKADNHHASWLNRQELSTIALNVGTPIKTLDATLLAMEALDVRRDHSRLVFWFDN